MKRMLLSTRQTSTRGLQWQSPRDFIRAKTETAYVSGETGAGSPGNYVSLRFRAVYQYHAANRKSVGPEPRNHAKTVAIRAMAADILNHREVSSPVIKHFVDT
jgi:hypothetical protein